MESIPQGTLPMNYPALGKTWFLDFDGTMVIHRKNNSTKEKDVLLPGIKEFFGRISKNDIVVITTARKSDEVGEIVKFLSQNDLPYHYILADLPTGPRIVINDIKPSGYKTAYAVNVKRDDGINMIDIEAAIE